MNTKMILPALAIASCLPTVLLADDSAQAVAAKLLADKGAAMVMVEATIEIQPKVLEAPEALKAQIPDIPKQEQKTKSQGLVVDPSGIIAVPLAAINPAAMMAGGVEQQTPLGPIKIGAEVAFLSVTVLDADGVEHEAELALQDIQAGLALVRLKEAPADGWPAVKLVADAGHPEAFGPLLQIDRLGASLDRQLAVRRSRFVQELRVPGLFYEMTGPAGAPGFAAFDYASQFVGLGVLPTGLPPQEIAKAGVVLLPAQRIAPLVEKLRAAK